MLDKLLKWFKWRGLLYIPAGLILLGYFGWWGPFGVVLHLILVVLGVRLVMDALDE